MTQLLRNRAELVTLIAAPLVVTSVFGVVGWSNPERALEVAFVDEDHSALSAEARLLLAREPWLVVSEMDRDDAKRALDEGRDIRMAVIVPKGFQDAVRAGEGTALEVVRDPQFPATLAAARSVDRVCARIGVGAASARAVTALIATLSPTATLGPSDLEAQAQGLWDPPPVGVDTEEVSPSSVRSEAVSARGFDQSSLGWTTVFMLFVGLSNAAAIVEEREAGTLARLGAMPTTQMRIVVGKAGGAFATTIFEATILVVFGAVAFGVSWLRAPAAVALLLCSFAVFTSGAALLLGAFVRTRGEATAGVWAITFTMGTLGGSIASVEMMAPAMRRLAEFVPTRWLMEGLVDVVVRHQAISAALRPSAMLTLFGLILLAIASRYLRLS